MGLKTGNTKTDFFEKKREGVGKGIGQKIVPEGRQYAQMHIFAHFLACFDGKVGQKWTLRGKCFFFL